MILQNPGTWPLPLTNNIVGYIPRSCGHMHRFHAPNVSPASFEHCIVSLRAARHNDSSRSSSFYRAAASPSPSSSVSAHAMPSTQYTGLTSVLRRQGELLILWTEKVRPEKALAIGFYPGPYPSPVTSRSGLLEALQHSFFMAAVSAAPCPVSGCSRTIRSAAVTILKGPLGHGLEVTSRHGEVTIQTLRRRNENTAHWLASQSDEGPAPAVLSLGTKHQVAEG